MNYLERSDHIISELTAELQKVKETAQYWEIMAITDDLTGLYNRRILQTVEQKITDKRSSDTSLDVTILFIDLDDFGKLNKVYGDHVGDEALRLLGQTIRSNIRQSDIAIRKGGDEFVIFLLGTTPTKASPPIIRRFQQMLDGELCLFHEGATIPIRGSIGVFSYQNEKSPFQNLVDADTLMREQKSARKKAAALA